MPLPGRIGAPLALADARAVAVTGDGDFPMHVKEMETVARRGLELTGATNPWTRPAFIC